MTSRTTRRRTPHQRVGPRTEILEKLPVEEREVLVLSSFYGLARDEIAGIIDTSVDAVDALMRRAQSHLRVLLTGDAGNLRAA
jgi:DNA-directed RNA polymerase specialized sigma24 family protein